MRSVNTILVAGVAMLGTSAAFAADMRLPPPPMPPMVQDFGGWYLRGDVGMSNQKVKNLDNLLYHDPGVSVQCQVTCELVGSVLTVHVRKIIAVEIYYVGGTIVVCIDHGEGYGVVRIRQRAVA